jgi:hypothetical protein
VLKCQVSTVYIYILADVAQGLVLNYTTTATRKVRTRTFFRVPGVNGAVMSVLEIDNLVRSVGNGFGTPAALTETDSISWM